MIHRTTSNSLNGSTEVEVVSINLSDLLSKNENHLPEGSNHFQLALEVFGTTTSCRIELLSTPTGSYWEFLADEQFNDTNLTNNLGGTDDGPHECYSQSVRHITLPLCLGVKVFLTGTGTVRSNVSVYR